MESLVSRRGRDTRRHTACHTTDCTAGDTAIHTAAPVARRHALIRLAAAICLIVLQPPTGGQADLLSAKTRPPAADTAPTTSVPAPAADTTPTTPAPAPATGARPGPLFEALAENILESLSESDDETATALALETLQERLARPLRFNTSTYDELESLGLLSPWEIDALLRYRNAYGPITGAHELHYIPDFPAEKARRLAPFLSFEPATPPESLAQTIKRRGRHELALRYGRALYRSKAYTENRYAGTPDAAALRYRFQAENRLQIGLALEKDAGEKRIPDSWAGFIALGDAAPNTQGHPRAGALKSWIIGTYKLHFGYGLHLGGGLFGGGLDAELLARPGNGLKPFASTAESGYFSGSAVCLQAARRTEVTLFYSYRKIDAAVEDGLITSLPAGGYHRTDAECEKRRRAVQQVGGLAVEQAFRHAKIGMTLSYTFLDKPYQPKSALYNQFNRLSDKVLGGGFHYRALWRSLHFYGELGWSCIFNTPEPNNAPAPHPRPTAVSAALFQGLQWKVHPRFSLAAQWRHYPRTYGGYFVHAPGRQSKAYNESGFGCLARTNFSDRLHLDAAVDFALHGWFSYPQKPPFTDRRYDLKLHYAARRHALQVYALYQYRQSASNTPSAGNNAAEAAGTLHVLRLHLAYDSPCGFLYQSRLECRNFAKGWLIYQDFGYRLPSGKFSGNLRFALFQTASNQERFYAYESDLLYAAAFPAYAGRGHRLYILIRYKPFRFMTLEARYAHTLYDHSFTSGNGLNESPGGLRPEIKCQIRFTF